VLLQYLMAAVVAVVVVEEITQALGVQAAAAALQAHLVQDLGVQEH
jgi:hypothetical protein